jgi:predicted  nucleic acid-binding Zn-ribbon protein
MGETKNIRKRLKSLEQNIRNHEDKIAKERQRSNPDQGLIRHWEVEIRAWHREIERLERRLKIRRRRG